MKAMAVNSYGSIDRLALIDLPEPTPGKNQVRIQVYWSSVNPADSKVITGKVKFVNSVDQDLAQIAKWIDEKRLRTPIGKTYEFKNLPQALHQLELGGVQGKIAAKIQ